MRGVRISPQLIKRHNKLCHYFVRLSGERDIVTSGVWVLGPASRVKTPAVIKRGSGCGMAIRHRKSAQGSRKRSNESRDMQSLGLLERTRLVEPHVMASAMSKGFTPAMVGFRL